MEMDNEIEDGSGSWFSASISRLFVYIESSVSQKSPKLFENLST